MASKRIPIMTVGKDIEEDPSRASKRKGTSKERPRASKRKRVLKARKDLQNDPPTSCTAETTIRLDFDCSHPSSTYGYCDVCWEYLPVYCRPPLELVLREFAPPKDVGWFRPRR